MQALPPVSAATSSIVSIVPWLPGHCWPRKRSIRQASSIDIAVMGTRERRLHAADQAAEVYGVDCNIRARQLGLSRADLVAVK